MSKKTAASGNAATQITKAKDSRKPVKLTDVLIHELLSVLPPRAKTARRMVALVASNPDSKTGDCNRISSVNLGHIKRTYNPYLRTKGLELDCRYPETPILNAFGEPSGQVLWGLYRVEELCMEDAA